MDAFSYLMSSTFFLNLITHCFPAYIEIPRMCLDSCCPLSKVTIIIFAHARITTCCLTKPPLALEIFFSVYYSKVHTSRIYWFLVRYYSVILSRPYFSGCNFV